MLDNLKIITHDQTIIQRLADLQGFERYRHRNNNYYGLCRYGKLMRLDFRKSFENGVFAGFRHLEISISPHYHYNNYLHNGNDFTPLNCIKTIADILHYITLKPDELDTLKVVNIEFGLNLIPETDIKNLIDGILYFKKTAFIIPKTENGYSKITDATKYKQIKAYAKGLQFAEFPQYGINLNTFRFEVKSKKSTNIEKYGIDKVADLLKIETYHRLGQEIINEWDLILLRNQTPDFSTLNPDEVQFVHKANKNGFWEVLKLEPRNKFNRYKGKYYKILKGKNNMHTQIKGQIIEKLLFWSSGAYCPQKTPINSGKQQNGKDYPKEINGQFAPPHQNVNICLITELDISMQKPNSKYLCSAGLKYFNETEPETYQRLKEKYLNPEKWGLELMDQFYYIAHNVRNEFYNKIHNRKRFEQRNYPKQQLQFNF